MAAPLTVGLPAVPRSEDPAAIGRRAAPAAITLLAIPTAARMAITAAPTMVAAPITAPIMGVATIASMPPRPRFMPAVASQPGSQSGRQRLRRPQNEATTLPITTPRPISGRNQAAAVPPAAIQDEQLPPPTKAA